MLNLKGQKYNQLTVIERCGSNSHKRSLWLCRCDCGNETIVESCRLRSGHSKSCGCRKLKTILERNFIHGQSKTRLYRIWGSMKDRCKNSNTPCFERYGKRGITVCKDWHKFELFRQWAVSNGYSENLSIDRINNDGNYCPENCRWSTLVIQNNNTQRNVFYEFMGDNHTVAEWSVILNFKRYQFYNRIKNNSAQEVLKSLALSEY